MILVNIWDIVNLNYIVKWYPKSPNTFLKEYRLNKALGLLNRKKGNVSEIAFEAGFNSLSYFSKCFQKRYKLLPSDYLSSNFT